MSHIVSIESLPRIPLACTALELLHSHLIDAPRETRRTWRALFRAAGVCGRDIVKTSLNPVTGTIDALSVYDLSL